MANEPLTFNNLNEVKPEHGWCAFTSIGIFSMNIRIKLDAFKLENGSRGYVKCNFHNPDYYQVVTQSGSSIICVYALGIKLFPILSELKAMNDQSRPENYWHNYWKNFHDLK